MGGLSPLAIVWVALIFWGLFWALLLLPPVVFKILRTAGLMALLLLVSLPTVAIAQTSTPTPTITPWPSYTPTVTPTPGGLAPTPTPPSAGSTIIWGCWLAPEQAPVCTWGDYFEQHILSYKRPGDGNPSVLYAPGGSDGSNTGYGYLVFIPPANTRSIEATCSEVIYAANADFGTGSSGGTANRIIQTWSPYLVLTHDAAFTNRSETCNATSSGDVVCSTTTAVSTYSVDWTLGATYSAWPAAWEDEDSTPDYADATDYAGLRIRAHSDGSGALPPNIAANNYGRASVRVACQIDLVTRTDGSTYVPGTPTVGDAPTATPCPDGQICVSPFPTFAPFPIGTIPVPTRQTTVTLGIGDRVEVDCFTIVPNTEHTVTTWFGDYGVGFDGAEVCTNERSIELVVDEFDFGSWAMGLFGVMGLGVIWVMFRR